MTTPKEIREWGIANGLAKPGRGRISAECRAAYHDAHNSWPDPIPSSHGTEAYEDVPLPFEEPEELKPDVAYVPKLPTEVVRDENLSYTIDLETSAIVGSDRCSACTNWVNRCACPSGPSGVRWLPETNSPDQIYLVRS